MKRYRKRKMEKREQTHNEKREKIHTSTHM